MTATATATKHDEDGDDDRVHDDDGNNRRCSRESLSPLAIHISIYRSSKWARIYRKIRYQRHSLCTYRLVCIFIVL